jgi:hypothetical protein
MATTIKYSLDYLKERDYITEKVEQWIPRTSIRKDLFGFGDIVAIREDVKGVIAVQSTTISGLQAHCDKAMEECGKALYTWLTAGNQFIIHGWDGKDKLEIRIANLSIDKIIYFVEVDSHS